MKLLVPLFGSTLLQESARELGAKDDTNFSSPILQEIKRLKMAGAWKEGDSLFFAAWPGRELEGPNFTSAVARYDAFLMAVRDPQKSRQIMDKIQYCLYTGIDVFFDRLVIRGPDGKEGVVRTEAFERVKKYTR